MEHTEEKTEIAKYLEQKAPIIYLVLKPDGAIERMNHFACNLFGKEALNSRFQDLIFNQQNTFTLEDVIEKPETDYLLHIISKNGQAKSFYFFFSPLQSNILVFGHADVEKIETLSQELWDVNQELNNLMRDLNVKNRELKQANDKILEMSRTDPLTKCANRRYLNERIQDMVSLAKRQAQPLSAVMTDIDLFKEVNDRFGHKAGDLVLQEYGRLLRQFTRAEDLVVRYGGEEFVMLLPLTDSTQAFSMSERIRRFLLEKDFLNNKYQVTASFGVSQLRDGDQPMDLVNRADEALYRAKEGGRNRTVVDGYPERASDSDFEDCTE